MGVPEPEIDDRPTTDPSSGLPRWLARLFGWTCCGEWTPWETKKGTYQRAPRDPVEMVLADSHAITFTRRWQERRCSACGRIQQREMMY